MSEGLVAADRAVLERIVRQLEPMERELSFLPSCWVEDKTEEELRPRIATGLLFLRQALYEARRALASDDPELIGINALHCQTLFADGRLMLFKRNETTILASQRGRKSGKASRRKAEAKWQPYGDYYNARLDSGIPYLHARHEVLARMDNDGVQVPKSPETIRKLFPKPSKKSSERFTGNSERAIQAQ